MKIRIFLAAAGLLVGLSAIGCQMEVGDDSEAAAAEGQTAESEQALAINCVGQCVAFYRACIRWGGSYEECAADREGCKDVCDEATCEPSDPGCCQGQNTCW